MALGMVSLTMKPILWTGGAADGETGAGGSVPTPTIRRSPVSLTTASLGRGVRLERCLPSLSIAISHYLIDGLTQVERSGRRALLQVSQVFDVTRRAFDRGAGEAGEMQADLLPRPGQPIYYITV